MKEHTIQSLSQFLRDPPEPVRLRGFEGPAVISPELRPRVLLLRSELVLGGQDSEWSIVSLSSLSTLAPFSTAAVAAGPDREEERMASIAMARWG